VICAFIFVNGVPPMMKIGCGISRGAEVEAATNLRRAPPLIWGSVLTAGASSSRAAGISPRSTVPFAKLKW
jgi:hypothetical protein